MKMEKTFLFSCVNESFFCPTFPSHILFYCFFKPNITLDQQPSGFLPSKEEQIQHWMASLLHFLDESTTVHNDYLYLFCEKQQTENRKKHKSLHWLYRCVW